MSVFDSHFFVSTPWGFETDADLYAALTRLRRHHCLGQPKDTPYAVYRVPGALPAEYDIDDFRPVVPGVEFVAKGKF